jgi:hypothetical protein
MDDDIRDELEQFKEIFYAFVGHRDIKAQIIEKIIWTLFGVIIRFAIQWFIS